MIEARCKTMVRHACGETGHGGKEEKEVLKRKQPKEDRATKYESSGQPFNRKITNKSMMKERNGERN